VDGTHRLSSAAASKRKNALVIRWRLGRRLWIKRRGHGHGSGRLWNSTVCIDPLHEGGDSDLMVGPCFFRLVKVAHHYGDTTQRAVE